MLFPLTIGFDGILEHDPQKWEPVLGRDHAQAKARAAPV
jgi:hypothetical protein